MELNTNQNLKKWVEEIAALCQPDDIYWCTGSQKEYEQFCEKLVANGVFKKLNPKLRPNSYLALSDPSDVAREKAEPLFAASHQKTPA